MATKLQVYNGALRKLGQPRLDDLSDPVKGRYTIDDCYDEVVERCLEEGYWNFAMRTVRLDASTTESTEFGYTYVFNKPYDWVRTYILSTDEYGHTPLLRYEDRTDYLLTDVDPIYFWYISNDTSYGLDLGRWPKTFLDYVQMVIAAECCEDITGSLSKRDALIKQSGIAKNDAMSKDAMNNPATKFPPSGSFVQARGGRYSSMREGRYRAG